MKKRLLYIKKVILCGNYDFILNGLEAYFDDFNATGPEVSEGSPGFSINPRDKQATLWGKLKRIIH